MLPSTPSGAATTTPSSGQVNKIRGESGPTLAFGPGAPGQIGGNNRNSWNRLNHFRNMSSVSMQS